MNTKLSTLSRTAIILLIATLTSGTLVSTAVSAHPPGAARLAGHRRLARRLTLLSACRTAAWLR